MRQLTGQVLFLRRPIAIGLIAGFAGLVVSLQTAVAEEHADVQKAINQGKYALALSLTEQALVNNPRNPQMRFWQARMLEQLGRSAEAEPVYLALTQDYPELAEPHNNLGVLWAAKGLLGDAQLQFELAIRAKPNYSQANENLADVILRQAQAAYQRAIANDPTQKSAQRKLQLLQPLLDLTERKQ